MKNKQQGDFNHPGDSQTNAGAGGLTILESVLADGSPGSLLNKRVNWTPDGKLEKRGYGNAYLFRRRLAGPVESISDLAAILADVERNPRACVVTGAPCGPIPLDKPARRLKYADATTGHPATLEEQSSPVLPIDLDGITIAGADVLGDPESVVDEAAAMLGPEFEDVSCFWSFTAGQHPTGEEIRLRLWFLLDRSLPNAAKRRWAEHRRAAGIPVDPAIYSAVQPIYTAAPTFEDGHDPLPRRSGFLERGRDVVVLDVPTEPARPRTADGEIVSNLGFDERLLAIGDHPGGAGVHNAIRDAIAAYVGRYGAGIDRAALKALIRQRLADADTSAHTPQYLETELSDRVLDASIEGAVRKFGESHKTPPPADPIETDGYPVTRLDARFLPAEALASVSGLVCVVSPLGSGKTEAMKLRVAAARRVLYVSHRRALCGQAAQRLGLADYRHIPDDRLPRTRKLSICSKSLWKLTKDGRRPRFDLVIIDEADQVVRQLASRFFKHRRAENIDAFRFLVARALSVYALDGTMTSLTPRYLHTLRQDIRFVINSHRAAAGQTIETYPTQVDLQSEVIREIEAGRRIFWHINERAEALKVHESLSTRFPDKTGILLHGENSNTPESVEILNDIDAYVTRTNAAWLIGTTTIGTGVSLDTGHFQVTAFSLNTESGTAADGFQGPHRNRNPERIIGFVSPKRADLPTDPAEVRAEFIEKTRAESAFVRLTLDGRACIVDPEYTALWCAVQAHRNASRNDFAGHFFEYCRRAGYTIVERPAEAPAAPEDREQQRKALAALTRKHTRGEIGDGEYARAIEKTAGRVRGVRVGRKLARAAVKRELIEAIVGAEVIDAWERASIERADVVTDAERNAAERFDVRRFFDVMPDEVDAALVEEWDEGRYPAKVRRFAIAAMTGEDAVAHSLEEQSDDTRYQEDLTHTATLHRALRTLLGFVGVTFDGGGAARWDGGTWDERGLQAGELPDFLRRHQRVLDSVLGVRVPAAVLGDDARCDPEKSPLVQYLGRVLRLVGLKTTAVADRAGRRYGIDLPRLSRTNALAAIHPIAAIEGEISDFPPCFFNKRKKPQGGKAVTGDGECDESEFRTLFVNNNTKQTRCDSAARGAP